LPTLLDLYEEKYLAFGRGSFPIKDWGDIKKSLCLTESARTTIQCHDKWDKMKKKYFQKKIIEGVTGSATTSWIWFDKMNKILEGTTKVDDTSNGLDHDYVHPGSSQALTIEKYLPNDDIGLSQVGNAPPQNPPSIIPTFGTYADTFSMGI
jgi:hypothetical protein